MRILSICPYCRLGKVAATDQAIGLSATCPNCRASFTIVESGSLVKEQKNLNPTSSRASRSDSGSPDTPVRTPTPLPFSSALSDSSPVIPARQRLSGVDHFNAPKTSILSSEPSPMAESQLPLVLSLLGIILGGMSLTLSQTISTRIVPIGVAGLGLMLGIGTWFLCEGKWKTPALASVGNAMVLLVLTLSPETLGFRVGGSDQPKKDRKVKVYHTDQTLTDAPEWIDTTKVFWQKDDIRVSIKSISIAPLETVGANDQKRMSQTKYLQIVVRTANIGLDRRIPFPGWNASDRSQAPLLTDSSGNILKLKSVEFVGEGSMKPVPISVLLPQKSVLMLLGFDPPGSNVDSLRLELPGSAFGETETVRYWIPKSEFNSAGGSFTSTKGSSNSKNDPQRKRPK
jgi:hypothetical protein